MSCPNNRAKSQLKEWKQEHAGEKDLLTTSTGVPLGNKTASLTVGKYGPVLMQDFPLIDEMQTFNRQRIPERVVHAKGTGAFGYFEVTNDITSYCKAKLFEKVGKRTPIAARFSTATGEKGSADTVRDLRGLGVKFYTEEGNLDILCLQTPNLFVRDAMQLGALALSFRRNPQTGLKDPNMFWDFLTLRPEGTLSLLFFMGDRGIPDGYRYMEAHAGHAFKTINEKGEAVYVKIAFKPDLGCRYIPSARAQYLRGADPDYSNRDFYNAIAKGDYPTYTFYIQVMTMDQAKKNPWNPFDLTRVWPHGDFPMIPVGRLVFNRNPRNIFVDVEQIAFCPGNLVPGIEASPDKSLHVRVLSYLDTQRHRLGANFMQLPINCPLNRKVNHYQRDGPQNMTDNFGGAPNYFPNSFGGPEADSRYLEHKDYVYGDVARYDDPEDEFDQAKIFYEKVLDPPARRRLVDNTLETLREVEDFIQERALKMFSNVSEELVQMLREGIRNPELRLAAKI